MLLSAVYPNLKLLLRSLFVTNVALLCLEYKRRARSRWLPLNQMTPPVDLIYGSLWLTYYCLSALWSVWFATKNVSDLLMPQFPVKVKPLTLRQGHLLLAEDNDHWNTDWSHCRCSNSFSDTLCQRSLSVCSMLELLLGRHRNNCKKAFSGCLRSILADNYEGCCSSQLCSMTANIFKIVEQFFFWTASI